MGLHTNLLVYLRRVFLALHSFTLSVLTFLSSPWTDRKQYACVWPQHKGDSGAMLQPPGSYLCQGQHITVVSLTEPLRAQLCTLALMWSWRTPTFAEELPSRGPWSAHQGQWSALLFPLNWADPRPCPQGSSSRVMPRILARHMSLYMFQKGLPDSHTLKSRTEIVLKLLGTHVSFHTVKWGSCLPQIKQKPHICSSPKWLLLDDTVSCCLCWPSKLDLTVDPPASVFSVLGSLACTTVSCINQSEEMNEAGKRSPAQGCGSAARE